MTQLTVHQVDDQIVRALKKRALELGQSAEAKRRYFVRKSLRGTSAARGRFKRRAAALRSLVRSSLDSTFLMRRHRARVSHP